MDDDAPMVVGKPEIADGCGVDRGTPSTWQRRELLPDPDHPPVNGQPAWKLETIRSWALSTGRKWRR